MRYPIALRSLDLGLPSGAFLKPVFGQPFEGRFSVRPWSVCVDIQIAICAGGCLWREHVKRSRFELCAARTLVAAHDVVVLATLSTECKRKEYPVSTPRDEPLAFQADVPILMEFERR